MLKLVGTDGSRFYSWPLAAGRYVIGRKVECDLPVVHKTVSRHHAELDVSPEGICRLSDLGSHNGTFVNGERVTGSVTLNAGDTVMFGQTEFRLTDETVSGPSTMPSSHTMLVDADLGKSVYVSINEALKPLPTKVTERSELLPTLFEMAKMLTLPEPQETMLPRALEMIARVIPSQRLAVLFVSDDQEKIYTGATRLADGTSPGTVFQLSRTNVREIMNNKNAILIGDPLDDPRFATQQSIIMSEIKSALAVPLFDEGRVLGILYADTGDPQHRYDNDHLRVLATFGNIIASKLLSYELIAQRQEKEIMDVELRRASAIQKRLLVAEPPLFAGFEICAFQEPSRSVGGDLYDMKLLDDGRLLLMVADVSGKGMGAALLMSNILASFRILYQTPQFDLLQAVCQVSNQMLKFSDPGDFATLFIALAEPGGTLRYVNAGHNSPLLVRVDGSMEKLEPSGPMIGAFDFAPWCEQTSALASGDLMLIFSDGVTEATGPGGLFGDERTERRVCASRAKSARGLIDDLMSDIDEFVGDTARSDDITIMVLKRTRS